MTTYQLSRLSPADFEELSHDLLQAEWGVKLECFKTGPDHGIDLRYIAADKKKTVIQCKHYAGSNISTLLSKLRHDEKAKVDLLSPSRYILVTSLGLSPENKEDVVDVMRPHIVAIGDVIGATDIEGLLRKFPDVEKSHFKLWLSSTAVLERVLFNAERCLTDFRVEQIQRKIPLYVQSDALPRAAKILGDNKYVVISGPPGIGKTTLAEILIYEHLQQDYEPVVIQSDLVEGRRFFRSDRKQIFYFDDFLGQTYLGDQPEFFLGQNRDKSLSEFLEMIQSSKFAHFIMTTREHIFVNALKMSGKLRESGIHNRKCLIELNDYRKAQKARILYNHLYFSEIPTSYKQSLLNDKIYLKVISHSNFTPRVIEWLSSYDRLPSMDANEYGPYILSLLENPEDIWLHAFEREISQPSRNLLISLYSSSYCAKIDVVETNFNSFHRYSAAKYHYAFSSADYRNAMKELEGTFFRISEGELNFINPSVRDL